MLKKCKKPLTGALALCLTFAFIVSTALAAEIPESLIPMGNVIGITIKTKGAIISELSDMDTGAGKVSPARDAGLLPGDVIEKINGTEVTGVESLIELINASDADSLTLQVSRNGGKKQVTLTPYEKDGARFIGIWARDSLSGIGTVTFCDPVSGSFGALGHAVCDTESGEIMPVQEGHIMPAEVSGVTPGKSGEPGQLGGTFSQGETIGEINTNCAEGIFGVMLEGSNFPDRESVGLALNEEIKTGPAKILSAVSGDVEEYSIEITRLYPESQDGRSMMLKVTDERLLNITGGIVQGMSGSPIMQDGKLVGAVTHVLINDPQKGYGISIQEMLKGMD